MNIRKFSSNATNHSSLHSPHHNHTNSAPLSSAPPARRHGLREIMADDFIKNARNIIKKWNVDAGKSGRVTSLFLTDREEARKLLEATINLHHAMDYYVKLSTTSKKLVRAHGLMQIAMQRLKFEFYSLLSANTNNLNSESFSSGSSVSIPESYDDGVSENREITAAEAERAVEDLKSVAECMIACGYGKECANIYQIVRKSIVDETVYCLGIEGVGKAQLKKMEWENLEARIKIWLRGVKIAVQNLFCREKILCDAVFSSSEKVAEACFAAICNDAAAELFAFAESVCKCKKVLSPEKIFRLLDLYEAISNLWPEIEFIFSTAVKSQAAAVQLKLGETVRAMLGQFEEAIRKDSSQPPPGGGIHPLTRYVMNFLVFLGDYAAALSNIFENWPVKVPISPPEADASTAESSGRLSWLILLLLCKLDGKAAAYDDVALSYLYLANNLNYVVSKVKSSNLGILIGKDWIRKHELKIRTYLANYERIGWGDVIAAVTPPWKVRESLELFYLSFQEAARKQRAWVISDPKIREDVKISLAKKIVSGYRILRKESRRSGLIVRYTPKDLDNYLSAMFTART